MEAEHAEIRRSLEWLVEEAARNADLRDTFDDSIGRRRDRLSRVENKLAGFRSRQGDVDQRLRHLERIRDVLGDFDAIWDTMDLACRRRVISILFERLTLASVEGGSQLHLKPFFAEAEDVFIPALNRRDRPDEGVEALTQRECEVLHLRAQGLSVTELAEQFEITRAAVHQHRYNIRAKLHVESDEKAMQLSRDYVEERLPFLQLEGRRRYDPEPDGLGDAEMRLLPDLRDDDLRYKDIAEKHGIRWGR